MTNFNNVNEFYPTPEELLKKMTDGIAWRDCRYVLEPSAGKGNIVDFCQKAAKGHYVDDLDVDCIEIDPELRACLIGGERRVVHDDFLTYKTFKKYDLIIMNPPFSNGDEHLLKALEMQKDGGAVVCLLNAQTIKSPHTRRQNDLVAKLEEYDASITYIENAFSTAERPTGVEIAMVKVYIPAKKSESKIYEKMKAKRYTGEDSGEARTDIAPNDFVEAIVRNYEIEIEAGIELIKEYKAMTPYLLDSFKKDDAYSSGIITLKIGGHKVDVLNDAINTYVKRVRRKYWEALFKDPRFTEGMTSNLYDEYTSKVNELIEYDFSTYNIRTMQIEMSKELVRGVEDCIIKLFDTLSYQYSYSSELSKNIHYYNGWKTNKSWYINKKVIIPGMNAWGFFGSSYDPCSWDITRKLDDIEKALDYLDGGKTENLDMKDALKEAKDNDITKKIPLKHFTVTFYKKGTCHIEFRDEELLKKFNIFGSQQKGWLPPGYGKKKYSEMDESEKAVIDEFEGEKSYDKVLADVNYYIYNPERDIKRISSAA